MRRWATGRPALSLALLVVVEAAAAAQGAVSNPGALVGGSSACPTPDLVWEHLLLLVPGQLLVERLARPGGAVGPVQIVDLGPSFRVIAGNSVREYQDEARDCARRAQFAAVFVAVAAGAGTAPSASPPKPPVVDAVSARANAALTPLPARARLDLGATVGAAMGGGETALAPGLSLRAALGRRRLVPVAALTVLAPFEAQAGGVDIRQWQATADAGVRAMSRAGGGGLVYVELGAAAGLLWDRPTNLAVARTQVSFVAGPRAAAGVVLATGARLSPFLLVHAIWFPNAPELFALPAGELGRAAWNVGATAGASWGLP
ncbi:MAG TPA: hypothetical protein VN962_18650 [Polyangia bacterium]|nr:hypothetical protein [Polyangia bacterium]